MRLSTVAVAAVGILCSSAEAAGFAKVVNKCSFPLYAWSVDPAAVGPRRVLPAKTGAYQETYRTKGVSIKISRSGDVASLYNGSPIMQYQYSLDGATVWYSLADTNGDIVAPAKVTVRPSVASCPKITWTTGRGPSAIDSCTSNANLVLTLCA